MSKGVLSELLKDDDYRRCYNQAGTILEVTEAICGYMKAHGITRSELARRMDKTKGYISQLLNGERNMTLETLADIMFALDCELEFKLFERGAEREDRSCVADTEWRRSEDTTIHPFPGKTVRKDNTNAGSYGETPWVLAVNS